MTTLETARLRLRPMDLADAEFILRLLNEPDFLRFIGDRGVRTLEDAEAYIAGGPQASYRDHGYGLLLVERRGDGAAIGMCGLMRKPWLPQPDIAYAFLAEAAGRGYAFEAAQAVLEQGVTALRMAAVCAVVTPDNVASIRLLEKLGFVASGTVAEPASGAALAFYEYPAEGRMA